MIRPHEDTGLVQGGIISRIKRRQLLRIGFLTATLLATAELTGVLVPFIRVIKIEGLGAKIPAGKKADILAQANLDGGGNTDEKRRAKTPLPVMPKEQPTKNVAVAAQTPETKREQRPELMTQINADVAVQPHVTGLVTQGVHVRAAVLHHGQHAGGARARSMLSGTV